MSGDKALHRIRVQDAGYWNPAVQKRKRRRRRNEIDGNPVTRRVLILLEKLEAGLLAAGCQQNRDAAHRQFIEREAIRQMSRDELLLVLCRLSRQYGGYSRIPHATRSPAITECSAHGTPVKRRVQTTRARVSALRLAAIVACAWTNRIFRQTPWPDKNNWSRVAPGSPGSWANSSGLSRRRSCRHSRQYNWRLLPTVRNERRRSLHL